MAKNREIAENRVFLPLFLHNFIVKNRNQKITKISYRGIRHKQEIRKITHKNNAKKR